MGAFRSLCLEPHRPAGPTGGRRGVRAARPVPYAVGPLRPMTATRMRIAAPSAFMRGRPDAKAEALTELLFGEDVTVMFSRADWAEIESLTDGYKGFLPAAALGEAGPAPTHLVTALRTLAYPEPNLKVPPIGALSFQSRTRPTAERNGFAELAANVWIPVNHLAPIGTVEPNYLKTAKRFLEVPYLW